MNLALSLDNTLCQTSKLFKQWKSKLEINASTWRHSNVYKMEDFWRALEPFDDVEEFVSVIPNQYKLFIFTERPKYLLPITSAWLNIHGFPNRVIVPSSIKRYDCRLNHIDLYVDTDRAMVDTFRYDHTTAVWLNRKKIRLLNVLQIQPEKNRPWKDVHTVQ